MTGEIAGIPFLLLRAAILTPLPLNQPADPLHLIPPRRHPKTLAVPPVFPEPEQRTCAAVDMLFRRRSASASRRRGFALESGAPSTSPSLIPTPATTSSACTAPIPPPNPDADDPALPSSSRLSPGEHPRVPLLL